MCAEPAGQAPGKGDVFLKIALFMCVVFLLGFGVMILTGTPPELPTTSDHVLRLKQDQFKNEVLNWKEPVLVDFGASWCGACASLSPKLGKLSREYNAKLKFVSMDVDYCRDIVKPLGIDELPCLILFKDGKEAARRIGDDSTQNVRDWIDASLKSATIPLASH